MITGVIYKYTCPVGKHYIGQTTNECYRRGLFFLAKHYGGYKIDKARKEFGPENFTYEVLIKNIYADIDSAKADLDKLESYYISLYDSVSSGYNIQKGNHVEITSTPNPERNYKDCGVNPIKNHNSVVGHKEQFKGVKQYNLEGELLATYESLSEASRCTKIDLGNIVKCCQGKAKRVRNFIFKYNN